MFGPGCAQRSDKAGPARNHRRVASFGFRVWAAFDWTRPWASVRPLLSDPGVTLEPYGRLERTIPFFRNQFGMQMRKRLRSR